MKTPYLLDAWFSTFIYDSELLANSWQLCILVAGALGGRFDHEAGNINVLCLFKDTKIILISNDCLIHLLPKAHNHEIHILSSVVGPHCGLIPIGTPSKSTTTTGLQWDLSKYCFSLIINIEILLQLHQGDAIPYSWANCDKRNKHRISY